MKKTRLISILLCLLALCCLFTSCNKNEPADTTPNTTPEAATTTRNRPTYTTPQIVTTAKEPNPEDMPSDGNILVGGVNVSSYTIIYGGSPLDEKAGSLTRKTIGEDLAPYLQGEEKAADFDYQCAVRLQQLIKEYFGVDVEIAKDDDVENPSRYEILVGDTNRLGSKRAKSTLKDKPENYLCGPNDATANLSTQYVICGGSYGATWHAIDALEAHFEANKTAEKVDIADVDVEAKCELTFIACIGDSITRGSQALPQLPHYGDADNVTEAWGSSATTVYFEQYLSYPATLQRELWKDAIVYNFGRGASTARNYEGKESQYYAGSAQFTKCLATSNLNTVDFDIVFLMHGTNDAGYDGGAANWDNTKKNDFLLEIKNQMDKILEGSPNATFVMNNAPHRCDGDAPRANDTAIRDLQKDVAVLLKEEGYNVYHYDMEAFTTENLRSADKCGSNSAGEAQAHEGFYNIYISDGVTDKTHPNYAGYGKMAEGLIDVVDYLVNGAEAPEYMINIG